MMSQSNPEVSVPTVTDEIYREMEITPLVKSSLLTESYGVPVYYKREDQTPVKSFKIRGALARISQLSVEEQEHGVIAASAGNHAQGVSYGAKKMGIHATIVMPETTPLSKVNAVSSMGAHILLHGSNFDEAFDYSKEIQANSGATYIHPFDDPYVIAGQGSIAQELLQQNPNLSHIFVPVGGGGLLAGITNYVKKVKPSISVVGVEPEGSDAMRQSIVAGERIMLRDVGIFADGVAVKQVGALAYESALHADDFITVNEDELCVALTNFFEETGSKLETAGALSIAGLQRYVSTCKLPKNSTVAVICSGANIDTNRFIHVVERAERIGNQSMQLRIDLPEKPGALLALCKNVVSGHNIELFDYRKNSTVHGAHITIGLRTLDSASRINTLKLLDSYKYTYTDLSANPIAREQGALQAMGDTPNLQKEVFYGVEFFDKPGALHQFLEAIGNKWNISMFRYSGSLGDVGRVLIGFENTDTQLIEQLLKQHTNSYENVNDAVIELYGQQS